MPILLSSFICANMSPTEQQVLLTHPHHQCFLATAVTMFGADQTYPALCVHIKYLVLCIPMLLVVLCACRALASHGILLLPGVSSACEMDSYMLLLKFCCALCRDGWQCSYALCNMYQDGEERVGSHAGNVCCPCAAPLPVGSRNTSLDSAQCICWTQDQALQAP